MTEQEAIHPRAEVARLTRLLEKAGRGPNAWAAIEDLIGLGLMLADQGVVSYAQSVLAALNRLRRRQSMTPLQEGWLLNLRTLFEFDAGRLTDAARTSELAIELAIQVGDANLNANSQMNAGIVKWVQGDARGAIGNFREALAQTPTVDTELRYKILVDIVGAHLDLNEDVDARAALDQLVNVARDGGDVERAGLLGLQGLVAVRDSRLDRAEVLFQRSAAAARRRRAFGQELTAAQNLAAVRLDLDRPGAAIRSLRRAERLAQRIENYRVLDAVQRTLATALHRRGRRAAARRVLEGARKDAADRGDRSAVARLTADLGALTSLEGKYEAAIPYFEEAGATFARNRDERWGLLNARNEAVALVELGSLEDARRQLGKAIRRHAPDIHTSEEAWMWFADLLLDRGHPDEASRAYQAVLTLVRSRPDRSVSDALAEIGATFEERGHHSKALRFQARALRAYDARTSDIPRYQIRNDRAISFLGLNQAAQAAIDLELALDEATDASDRAMMTMILTNSSECARRLGDSATAQARAERAIGYAKLVDDDKALADGMLALGLAQLDGGQAEARSTLRSASRLARKHGPSVIEAVVHGALATEDLARKRFRSALQRFKAAAKISKDLGDVVLEAESVAAISELAVTIQDNQLSLDSIQRLIDLVQNNGAPLDLALVGLARTGDAWLAAEDLEDAAGAFAAGIVLAAVEAGDPNRTEFWRTLGRAAAAPFAYGAARNVPSETMEQAVIQALRENVGKRLSLLSKVVKAAAAAHRTRRGSKSPASARANRTAT